MTLAENISVNLKKLLTNPKYNLKYIQDETGIKIYNLKKYICGGVCPTIKSLISIAKALDINPAEIMKPVPNNSNKNIMNIQKFYSRLAEQTSKFMMKNSLNLNKMTALTGVSHSRLIKIIKGENFDCRIVTIEKFTTALGLDITKLLDD